MSLFKDSHADDDLSVRPQFVGPAGSPDRYVAAPTCPFLDSPHDCSGFMVLSAYHLREPTVETIRRTDVKTSIVLSAAIVLLALTACTGNSQQAVDPPVASSAPTVDVEGRKPVAWKLAGPKPAPDETRIEVQAAWIACTSGSRPEDPQPAVTYAETTISVTIWAIPPSGNAFTCQGNPSSTVIVKLDEPVGDRRIIQGPEAPY